MRVVLATLALFAAVALARGVARAEPCPVWISGAMPTATAGTYAVSFVSSQEGAATLRLRLFAGDRAYEARFGTLPFTEHEKTAPGNAALYDATPVFVRLPDALPRPDGASLAIVDPDAGTSLDCAGRDVAFADLVGGPSPFGGTNRSTVAARGYRSSDATVDANAVPAPAASCARPYVEARVRGPAASIDYPPSARSLGQTGRTDVAVELDASGRVAGTYLFASSGFATLDAAAVTAAKRTAFEPQIFRCDPVAGVYLFQADFER